MVIPSLSLPQDELRRITGARCYEERLLFLLLTLKRPGVKVVYLTSAPVDPAIVDYYLDFLDDPAEARARLEMISLGDPRLCPLTEKILHGPRTIARIQEALDGTADAWLVPFVVSEAEERLSAALGLPIYGPATALAQLGSKSGARTVAEDAKVPLARGFADLRSLTEVEHAARALAPLSHGGKLMVKLNNSYSGLGNAIVVKDDRPLTACHTSFSAADENWTTFAEKIAERGAVIEEFIDQRPLYSPAPWRGSPRRRLRRGGHARAGARRAQRRRLPGLRLPRPAGVPRRGGRVRRADRGRPGGPGRGGAVRDGLLRRQDRRRLPGPAVRDQPAHRRHDPPVRRRAADHRRRLRPRHRHAHVRGPVEVLRRDGQLRRRLPAGPRAGEIVARIRAAGLGFDRETRTGNVLHLLGAIPEYGKLGFTSIGNSAEEAAELHRRTLRFLCPTP
nr:hypothetical protein GCM10020093_090570 [Planobispora longispora]